MQSRFPAEGNAREALGPLHHAADVPMAKLRNAVLLRRATGVFVVDGSYGPIAAKVREMDGAEARPMFGYRCFLVSGKFFVGFDNKSDFRVIVRLPKYQQKLAVRHEAIKPFSRGAKAGWIELDSRRMPSDAAMKWISEGYDHAKRLAGENDAPGDAGKSSAGRG